MGKKLFLFAAAAVALASCTETDLSGDTSFAKESTSDAIQFSAKAGNSGVTRAEVAKNYNQGAIGNADGDFTTSLQKARFGVFAYHTSTGDYNPATVSSAPSNIAPNFMYNQELKYDDNTASGVNAWVYDPVKYWPNGIDAANVANNPSNTATELNKLQRLSFFAVAPFTATPTETYTKPTEETTMPSGVSESDVKANTATKGIAAMTTNTFTGNVWVKYLMPDADESKAVDLLWGVRGQKSYSETDGTNNTVDALGNFYNINLTKQTVDEKVKFLFKHALAKIGGSKNSGTDETTSGDPAQCGFKVLVDIDANSTTETGTDNQSDYFGSNFTNSKTLVTIKEVKIQDGGSASSDANVSVSEKTSDLATSGWFNIEKGSWEATATKTTGGATYNVIANDDATLTNETYRLNEKILEIGAGKHDAATAVKKLKDAEGKEWSDNNPTGVTTTAQNLFANENVPGLLLIPGSDAKLYITVDYFVRTADPNLSKGYSEVEQIITNEVSLSSLNPNKYYTIIMHLGLTSVKFEAVVADWVTNDGTEFNEDGTAVDPTSPTENQQSTWLPSNVITSQNITLNLPANATSSSVTLNSMAAGEYTSDKTDIIASGTVLPTETGHKTLSIGGLTANESTTETKTTVVKITDAAPKVYTITIIQAIKP